MQGLFKDMKPEFVEAFAPFIGPEKLNIGCGASPEPGWVNMDFNPQLPDVIKWDLRIRPWPFPRACFDTVLATHVLEHFRGDELFHVMAEIGEVLKVGGHLIGAVPYATHSSAYANPFHKQLWDISTPPQFSKRLYEEEGTAGTGAHQFMPLVDWVQVYLTLTPDKRWHGRPEEEISKALHTELNVIEEMQFVLRRES
jgi:SAM-dependent methyltransferase